MRNETLIGLGATGIGVSSSFKASADLMSLSGRRRIECQDSHLHSFCHFIPTH